MHYITVPLKEAFLFWGRNFLLLAIVTILTVAPGKILFWSLLLQRHHSGNLGLVALAAIDIFLKSVQESALLGLIIFKIDQVPDWEAMRSGMLAGWWKFMVINFAISLIGVIVTGNFVTGLLHNPDSLGMLKMLLMASVLVFALGYVKLGLTLPIIIRERLSLWVAIKRSWSMTNGDFGWSILICYFVVNAISRLCAYFTQVHFAHGQFPSLLQQVSLQLVQAQVDCLFIVLLGEIYQHFSLYENLRDLFKAEEPSGSSD